MNFLKSYRPKLQSHHKITLAVAALLVVAIGSSQWLTTSANVLPESGELPLPRVPWEGGPDYWKKFPAADAAGWDDPTFFPITVFLGKPSHAAQYKALGVNTYQGAEHDGSTIASMTDEGMYVIAQNEWTDAEVGADPGVVGWFVSDECEMGLGGCAAPPGCEGLCAEEHQLTVQQGYLDIIRARNDGRFAQANFGNGILGTWWSSTTMDDHMQMVDVASVDKYMYTSPHVQQLTLDSSYWTGEDSVTAVAKSASYGWLVDRMKTYQDPANLTPNWMFVEVAMPFLTEPGATTITLDQFEGAVWNAIIHEARGINYFQHNNNGLCGTYSLVDCEQARSDKVASVNAKIKSLAPVINTQSYQYDFNNGTDTMLKTYDGSAYVFAGLGVTHSPGSKTFNLPSEVNGSHVVVVGENRTLPITDKTFTDTFAAEYSHHVYQVVASAPGTADSESPNVTLTAPAADATVEGSSVPIRADATDNVAVHRVEFYIGTELLTVDYTAPYETTWDVSSLANGSRTISALSYDTSGNSSDSDSVTVEVDNPVGTATSIWSPTTTPTVLTAQDTDPVELGLRFKSLVAGEITGVRFYKSSTNTGTHVGNLWTNDGTKLATVTFSNETATGWQEALFSTPVAIAADTTYVVSYHAPQGGYSADTKYFSTKQTTNSPLIALQSSPGAANGLYKYGAAGTFPDGSYQDANYWVDVVFASTPSPSPTPTPSPPSPSPSPPSPSPSPAPSPPMEGDANGDNRVNAIDLSILISHDGQDYPAADFNKDGSIGAADLAILLGKWTW